MSDLARTDAIPVPEGFVPFALYEGFLETVGPLFWSTEGGRGRMGIRIEKRHCNVAGICHGGMLMTIADMQLGMGTRVQAGIDKFLPTINMSCDFVRGAPLGSWVEGETDVIRTTRNLAFARCILRADGEEVFAGNGIMKIPSRDDHVRINLADL
ncbi:PaaI family thioesterase [Oceanibacterium hippocampi]|nr:PaaI family thioesterase [Oceanibacterium hippocampi]